MKGILKKASAHQLHRGSRDLERVTQALPEDLLQRKKLVIQELQKNFRMLRNVAAIEDGEDGSQGAYRHKENEQEMADCVRNGTNGEMCNGNNFGNEKVVAGDGDGSGTPAREQSKGATTEYRTAPGEAAVGKHKPKNGCNSDRPQNVDFLSQIRHELSRRQLSYSADVLNESWLCSEEDRRHQELLPLDIGTDNVTGLQTVAGTVTSPELLLGNQKFSEATEEQTRPTAREYERERQRALREQTVLTKPLHQWRIPDLSGSADCDRRSMDPEQRLDFLRRLNGTTSPASTDKNGAPSGKKGNGDGDSSPDPSLSSLSDESFSFSKLATPYTDNGAASHRTGSARANVTAAVTTSEAITGDECKKHGSSFLENGSARRARQSANSPSSDAEPSKLRRFWEQRIDDNERNRQPELQRSTGRDTKPWRSLEVLSASLLSTLGQTVSHTGFSQLTVSARTEDTPEISNGIKDSPTLSQDSNGDSETYSPNIATYCNRLMETANNVVGTKGGRFEIENGTIRDDTTKFNEPRANSEVVRESIADAHRTRQLWQQRAASNKAPLSTPAVKPMVGRLPSWAPVAPVTAHPIPYSTQSLPRPASSKTRRQNGEAQIVEEVLWRPGFGPSSQMARQTKMRSGQGVSRIRNTIQSFENEIMAAQAESATSRPAVYTMCPSQFADQYQHQVPNGPFESGVVDSLENEKFLFLNYVQTHPEVVKSLGLSMPWQMIPDRPPSVKVELTVVESAECFYSAQNGHAALKTSVTPEYTNRNGNNERETNGIYRAHYQDHNDQQHRYVKHSNTSSISSSGSLKAIVRRQAHTIPDHASGHGGAALPPCSTMPRHWKLAEWEPPPPPCNKEMENEVEDGYVDDSGNVYRSAGESLIAREIREYRRREEELRRSRSELGLPNLEDLMNQGDNWKGTVGFEEGRLRDSRSYAHLQVNTDQDRGATTGDNSERHGRQWADDPDGRPASAGPKLQGHSPKSPAEKPLVIGGGGHKVAAYPPDLIRPTSTDGSVVTFQTVSEGDFMPVETRIEREVEDLRRREVELRAQREALGIRYYPVGLAQLAPHPTFSEFSLGLNDGMSIDGESICSVREYAEVRKGKVAEVINNRINGIINGQKTVHVPDSDEMQMVNRLTIASDGTVRNSALEGNVRKTHSSAFTVFNGPKDLTQKASNSNMATISSNHTVIESLLTEQYAESISDGSMTRTPSICTTPNCTVPVASEIQDNSSKVSISKSREEAAEENFTQLAVKKRNNLVDIEDVIVSI